MRRTQRLTEQAISFAIAEANEDLAVARLAFLVNGDHDALDQAIDACLAHRDRSLHTRWRALSFLVRVRYEDHPTRLSRPILAPAARPGATVGPRELPGPGARGPAGLARTLSRRDPRAATREDLLYELKAQRMLARASVCSRLHGLAGRSGTRVRHGPQPIAV